MKKLTIAVLFAIISFGSVVAQNYDTDEPKHEISLGYGAAINSTNMLEFLADVWTGGHNNRHLENDRYIGPLTAEYFYHVTPLIGVGAIGVYSHYKGDEKNGEGTIEEHSSTYFTFMPAVKLNWLRREYWGLYSKLGAGFTHGSFKLSDKSSNSSKETGSLNNFNFQASAIGVEVGSRTIRGFAEIGFGEQGIALAGVRLRF